MCRRFRIITPVSFWAIRHRGIWNVIEKIRSMHPETAEHVKTREFLRKIQTLRVNNSRNLRIKNAKFSGYCFYINSNIHWNSLICITVPLIQMKPVCDAILDFQICSLSQIFLKLSLSLLLNMQKQLKKLWIEWRDKEKQKK